MLFVRVALAAACAAAVAGNSNVTLVDVFRGGEFNYACYRIPALLRTAGGALLAFAEGRRFSCADHGWVNLVLRSSTDGGNTWSPLVLVHSESSPSTNTTIGNPAPVQLSNGSILLPFSRNNTGWGLLRSDDGGASWSGPFYQKTPADWTWIATGPPGSLQLPSGRVVIPIDLQKAGGYASTTLYSDNAGASWTVATPTVANANECQAAPLSWHNASTLLLSMRAAEGSSRLAALSVDGGASWGAPWTTVPETECEASTIALPAYRSGPILVMSSAFATTRSNMTLHTSRDDGHTWTPAVNVYPGAAAYSSLQAVGDDTVALLFERDDYAAISFATVAL